MAARLAIETPLTVGRARVGAAVGRDDLLPPRGSPALSTSVFRFGSGCNTVSYLEVSDPLGGVRLAAVLWHTIAVECTFGSLRGRHRMGPRIALRIGNLLEAHRWSGYRSDGTVCTWRTESRRRFLYVAEWTISRAHRDEGGRLDTSEFRRRE